MLRSEDKQLIREAIWLLHWVAYVGGIGSRARNGFGRFKINQIEGIGLEETFKVQSEIQWMIAKKWPLKPYTGFSGEAKLWLLESAEDGVLCGFRLKKQPGPGLCGGGHPEAGAVCFLREGGSRFA